MDDRNTSRQLYSTMSFSSYFPSPAGDGNDDSGSGSHGFPGGGLDPGAFVHGRGSSAELDFDAQDCDSEEGIGVLEEPSKPATLRGSGSKRSRAAEVHNLSEKRRRSRINEKMKALQNLIPNSNKTDKASMLDEAIEYLKQLQLQVQMLSMRNGLNLHPLYMPGGMQPFQSPQFCMGFGVDNGSSMNMGPGMLPLNLDPSARNSYGLSSQRAPSHQSMIMPGVATMASPRTSFAMESSQAHNRSFELPVAAEIFTEAIEPQRQLDSLRATRNLQENEMKPMPTVDPLHFAGQASVRDVLAGERPEGVQSKGPDNQIFMQQYLHNESSYPPGEVQKELPEF